jgi:hypothetical protein
MPGGFDPGTISGLASEEEVDIETSPRDGKPARRVTIWIVVVEGHVYVRSVRDPAGRWHRDLRRTTRGAIHLGDQPVAVHAVPVTDPETVGAISDA